MKKGGTRQFEGGNGNFFILGRPIDFNKRKEFDGGASVGKGQREGRGGIEIRRG